MAQVPSQKVKNPGIKISCSTMLLYLSLAFVLVIRASATKVSLGQAVPLNPVFFGELCCEFCDVWKAPIIFCVREQATTTERRALQTFRYQTPSFMLLLSTRESQLSVTRQALVRNGLVKKLISPAFE